jgi:ELWxxDGT repeat protein
VTSGAVHRDGDDRTGIERSVAAGGSIFFSAVDAGAGEEPWTSDGTAAGTRRVADLRPGAPGSHPTGFAAHGRCALFAANDGRRGHELWGSDGTGAFLVADVAGGEGSSSPGGLTVAGDRLYFAGDDGIHGRELFAVPAAALASRCTDPLPPPTPPPPPPGAWLTSEQVPGFRFKVQVSSGASPITGTAAPCVAHTLCVAGALPGRAELLARVVGPRPNGRLWPHLVKLTPSQADVWIEQVPGGELRHYRLAPSGPGGERLAGLVDRGGFTPPAAAAALAPDATGEAGEEWLTTPEVPGFRFRVRLGGATVRSEPCLAGTLCLSGAVAGRPEVFLRITGPRPNGRLWPLLARLTSSRVEVEVEQVSSGAVRSYVLPAVAPGSDSLDGLLDRQGFAPGAAPGFVH